MLAAVLETLAGFLPYLANSGLPYHDLPDINNVSDIVYQTKVNHYIQVTMIRKLAHIWVNDLKFLSTSKAGLNEDIITST